MDRISWNSVPKGDLIAPHNTHPTHIVKRENNVQSTSVNSHFHSKLINNSSGYNNQKQGQGQGQGQSKGEREREKTGKGQGGREGLIEREGQGQGQGQGGREGGREGTGDNQLRALEESCKYYNNR